VVLTTRDRTILFTGLLHWDETRERLFTDRPVRIVKKNGEVIRARRGMEADNRLEKVVFKGNVSGEFYENR
jgi:hypothetical protein